MNPPSTDFTAVLHTYIHTKGETVGRAFTERDRDSKMAGIGRDRSSSIEDVFWTVSVGMQHT